MRVSFSSWWGNTDRNFTVMHRPNAQPQPQPHDSTVPHRPNAQPLRFPKEPDVPDEIEIRKDTIQPRELALQWKTPDFQGQKPADWFDRYSIEMKSFVKAGPGNSYIITIYGRITLDSTPFCLASLVTNRHATCTLHNLTVAVVPVQDNSALDGANQS